MNQIAQDIQDAAREIRDLRRVNALLLAKVEGFEMAVRLVFSEPPPQPSWGGSPDIAWALDKHATEILARELPQQSPVPEAQ